MVIVTWIGVFPFLTLVVVFLMTYVVMPRLARLFKGWLYSEARSDSATN
jgi:antibiotic biosynthesis monooxygenase (ABM) superfamily enzyme